MTNYDLEEAELIKKQIGLSLLLLLSLIISLSLSYNELLKHENKEAIYDKETERAVLVVNRTIAFLIALSFLLINIKDKNIKQKYSQGSLKSATLQIDASAITLVAAIIVLYVAVNSFSSSIQTENSEI